MNRGCTQMRQISADYPRQFAACVYVRGRYRFNLGRINLQTLQTLFLLFNTLNEKSCMIAYGELRIPISTRGMRIAKKDRGKWETGLGKCYGPCPERRCFFRLSPSRRLLHYAGRL